jgi:hypothetical protein
MFIIFVLSFSKLNITIHSNIRFMVIIYNQNLHFRIHYKKFEKQYYNSFHHNLTLEEIHTEDEHIIHCKSLCFFILLKTWIEIIMLSHVLLKKIPKQHSKSMLYQNRVCGFLPQVPQTLPIFLLPKNLTPKKIATPPYLIFFLFSKTPPFNTIPSHIIMIQSNKNSKFKIQTNKVPWLIPILIALFILNHILSLPP